MKKLNLAYFVAIAFVMSGISAKSLVASVRSSVTDRVAIEKDKGLADVDSVIVGIDYTSSVNLLAYVKPVEDMDLKTMFKEKIKYPGDALEDGIEGTVRVKFTVEEDGSVSNIKAIEKSNKSLTNEVLESLKTIQLQPIIQNGFPVRYNLILPVKFELIER